MPATNAATRRTGRDTRTASTARAAQPPAEAAALAPVIALRSQTDVTAPAPAPATLPGTKLPVPPGVDLLPATPAPGSPALARSPRCVLPEVWEIYVADWLEGCHDGGAGDTVLAQRRGHLRRLALDLPEHTPFTLDGPTLAAWFSSLDLAPKTLQALSRSVRYFFGYLALRGYRPDYPAKVLPEHAQIAAQARTAQTASPGTGRPGLPDHGTRTEPRRGARRGGALPVPELWRKPLTDFDAYQRARGLSPNTRRTRRDHLARLARAFPNTSPWHLEPAELLDWYIAHDIETETRHSLRTVLREFYAWALTVGHVTDSPAEVLPQVRRTGPRPHPIPDHLLAQALADADTRQTLILRAAAEAGLRRAEIAAVHASDLQDTPDGTVLLVHGKGRKQRTVPLPQGLARLLSQATAADPDGWALPNGKGGHIGAQRVAHLVADLIPAPYTLHALRHRFATTAYNATGDLFAVQQLLGHSTPTTTQRYVATGMGQLRAAVLAVAEHSEYVALPYNATNRGKTAPIPRRTAATTRHGEAR